MAQEVYEALDWWVEKPALEHEYWQHRRSGETYAVRIQFGRVTGIVGPLDNREVHPALLPLYEYDDSDSREDAEGLDPDDYRLAPYSAFDREELTPAQVAALTATAESTWRNKAAAGDIPGARKAGKQWLLPRAVLRALDVAV